jgi:hypothetical protein
VLQLLSVVLPVLQVQLGVRGKIKFTLNNDEHLPFTFALDKASYDASDALLAASGWKPLLDIQPAAGTVAANSKVTIAAACDQSTRVPDRQSYAILHCLRLLYLKISVFSAAACPARRFQPSSHQGRAAVMHCRLSCALCLRLKLSDPSTAA